MVLPKRIWSSSVDGNSHVVDRHCFLCLVRMVCWTVRAPQAGCGCLAVRHFDIHQRFSVPVISPRISFRYRIHPHSDGCFHGCDPSAGCTVWRRCSAFLGLESERCDRVTERTPPKLATALLRWFGPGGPA